MRKSLIIVESITKIKTINKYINENDEYIIIPCFGHICNLPYDRLGFDTIKWETEYEIIKKDVVKKIRDNVKLKSIYRILIATDPDREGEGIAYHIKENINDLLEKYNKECYRIRFNEITKKALLESINNLDTIDINLVESQITRNILDKYIGYTLSPLLWKKFNNKILSAGRVQSIAVYICIKQQEKINNFYENINKNCYWKIEGCFKYQDLKITASLENNFNNIEETKDILRDLSFNDKYICHIKENIKSISPPPPYITTTLQYDAYNKYKISSKNLMKIAQTLYENGLITYMRTDSVIISEQGRNKIINYIEKTFGKEYVKSRIYKNKIANCQEAHEAIRITNPKIVDIGVIINNPSKEEINIYKLIWKRSVACLMIESQYLELVFDIKNFKCTKSFMIKEGFNMILKIGEFDIDKEQKEINKWQNLNKKEMDVKYFNSIPHLKEIPSLYDDVELIKELEKNGIGRPSTYSGIIDKILYKSYVQKGSNKNLNIILHSYKKTIENNKIEKYEIEKTIGGNRKDFLVPTLLGIQTTDYLKETSPVIIDINFTSKMESELDKIANGELKKIDVLNNIKKYI